MATISDKINQGLTNLYTSPLGMASLGLLMQPSMSRTPINPWQYAAQGMQLGIQNRAQQQQLQEEQARQAENDQMRRARYLMDIQRMQNERIQQEQAAVQAERERAAMQDFMSTLSPEEARMAAVLGPDYAKQIMSQRMRANEPTTLMRDLMAAGLQPNTPEFQQAVIASRTRPQVQVGAGPQFKVPAGYMVNPDGTGVVPIPGLPVKPPPMTVEQEVQKSAMQAEASARAKAAVKEEQSKQGVESAIQDMYSAVGQWRSNKTDVNALSAVSQQRRRLAQMLAQRRNPGRAPTDADVKIALEDIPDPLSAQQGIGSLVGGDPWLARMKVVEQELGISRGKTINFEDLP